MTSDGADNSTSGNGRLQDKVAIITGASGGIGRAIALRYASEGAHVVVSDIRDTSRAPEEQSKKTHDIVESMGRRSMFIKTDVTDSASVDALIAQVVEKFGRIDIMCNNAGAAFETFVGDDERKIWQMADSTWSKTLDLNCSGVFYGVRAASRQMMKQEPWKETGDRGWIINTASIMGQVAAPGACAYVASKHLVLGLTKSAALDLAPYRVHVNAICPGYVQSAFTAKIWENKAVADHLTALHPFRGLGEPEDIARIAVFLASDDARWVHGAGIVADGGFTCQ
jgi:NAD(P)-dependent dehydrogenase (short-subunit alcohol dehydrogenase family)